MLCSMSAGTKFVSTSCIYRMSGGSISSQCSQADSKSATLGQTGCGTDVGLESGNCAVELASHTAANTHLPDLLPPLLIYV